MPEKRKISFRWAICWAGWFLTLAFGSLIFLHIVRHYFIGLDEAQRNDWDQIMFLKSATLSQPWRDERPLILIVGDSHVEMGDWYDIFDGAFAIRNCGLSRAKIEDATVLAGAVGDKDPQAVILLCGFNNLAQSSYSVEACIDLYRKLLSAVQLNLHCSRPIVISVTPLHASPLDVNALAINKKIELFDQKLAELCQQKHAVFVNVNPVLVDSMGGLSAGLTIDGLHLNPEGYRRLGSVLLPYLPQVSATLHP